jgi:hypothetical protein
MLVLVLEVFCEESIRASLVVCKTRLAFFSLADLGDDAVAACLVVLCSWLGLAVALYVAALCAPICKSVRTDVRVVDAESSRGRWRCH